MEAFRTLCSCACARCSAVRACCAFLVFNDLWWSIVCWRIFPSSSIAFVMFETLFNSFWRRFLVFWSDFWIFCASEAVLFFGLVFLDENKSWRFWYSWRFIFTVLTLVVCSSDLVVQSMIPLPSLESFLLWITISLDKPFVRLSIPGIPFGRSPVTANPTGPKKMVQPQLTRDSGYYSTIEGFSNNYGTVVWRKAGFSFQPPTQERRWWSRINNRALSWGDWIAIYSGESIANQRTRHVEKILQTTHLLYTTKKVQETIGHLYGITDTGVVLKQRGRNTNK